MALGAMSEASCQGAKSEMVLRRSRVDMVLPHCGVSKHSQVPVTKEKNGEIVTVYEDMILSCPIQPGHTRALVCCSAGCGVGRRQECGQVGEFWK